MSQNKIDTNDFVIKKDAIPVIWNVFIVRERLIDGTSICNFLCPALQDMQNLTKEHFTKGFRVKNDDLIPAYEAGLYVINPFFEIHSLLLGNLCTPETLPNHLKEYYETYLELQQLSENLSYEQETVSNRPLIIVP